MARMLLLVILGLSTTGSRAQDGNADPRDLEFVQVAEDIHLAYRPVPLRYWVEGNVTIIVNEDDVVVVDGSGSNRSARQVIQYIRSLTDNPVSVLVNTHGHGDHTIGNSEYLASFPGVELVASPETRAYLAGSGISYVAEIAASTQSRKQAGAKEIARLLAAEEPGVERVVSNLRQYYDRDIDIRQQSYRRAVIVPPTITIRSGMTLHRQNRTIEIRYLGPGDTRGDLVVYLPEDRIVVAGDMVVHPFPYGFSRHALDWVNTLDSLAALDFEILIPGHGEVQRDRLYLTRIRQLLRFVQREVRSSVKDGLTIEQTLDRVDLSQYKDQFAGQDPVVRYYFDQYFAHPNVVRTYQSMVEASN